MKIGDLVVVLSGYCLPPPAILDFFSFDGFGTLGGGGYIQNLPLRARDGETDSLIIEVVEE